jgi:hypothetical protein
MIFTTELRYVAGLCKYNFRSWLADPVLLHFRLPTLQLSFINMACSLCVLSLRTQILRGSID